MNWTRTLVLFGALGAAGCATEGVQNCAGTDWSQLGWRDGIEGGPSLAGRYAAQCGAAGFNGAAYTQAWQSGRLERSRRRF